MSVRVAVAGVGNCANSLVQGVTFYAEAAADALIPGLMHNRLGPHAVGDLEFVAAFDVDALKVGVDLSEAIWASQNSTFLPASTRATYIGPSDHIPWLDDRKLAFVRLERHSFGNAPTSLEYKLEVWDSPNSAGVVIDAIRAAKIALDARQGGPLEGASAYLMKSPAVQHPDPVARRLFDDWITEKATMP